MTENDEKRAKRAKMLEGPLAVFMGLMAITALFWGGMTYLDYRYTETTNCTKYLCVTASKYHRDLIQQAPLTIYTKALNGDIKLTLNKGKK
jgi:hypothetical protein